MSYNAAGVLSHLASDGPFAWTISQPSREHVLERLVRAVTRSTLIISSDEHQLLNRWDVKARRDINYRSLSPIISLLSCHHTPGSLSQDESSNLKLFSAECQVWASWALANLTQWDEAKYCPLVAKEGGVEGIQGILARCAVVQSR